MVIEDALFYWGHRLLHHPKIYGKIHKRHHQFYTPVGVAAEYAHPIEYFVANSLPFSAGPMFIGFFLAPFHVYTFWLWFVLRIGGTHCIPAFHMSSPVRLTIILPAAETIDGHCGYAFPWTPYRLLPFSGSVGHHDFHHSKVRPLPSIVPPFAVLTPPTFSPFAEHRQLRQLLHVLGHALRNGCRVSAVEEPRGRARDQEPRGMKTLKRRTDSIFGTIWRAHFAARVGGE